MATAVETPLLVVVPDAASITDMNVVVVVGSSPVSTSATTTTMVDMNVEQQMMNVEEQNLDFVTIQNETEKEETEKKTKTTEEFRNYTNSIRQETVERHYSLMRSHQTYEFVQRMEKKYHTFQHDKMTIWDAFEKLKHYIDSSDPDTSLPNLEHMLQTAEAIRYANHPDWFQLIGLIHDLGKIMFLWGTKEDGQQGTGDGDQWALGGDTWVVGCALPKTNVFPQYNHLNPDMTNPKYNTSNGIYTEQCGLDQLTFAYGHDEYLYRFLLHNKVTIPQVGLNMIRYHSCYPWHTGGEYRQFMSTPTDYETLQWVTEFNKFDLYTKAEKRPNVQELWPYYQTLIDKYMPGILEW